MRVPIPQKSVILLSKYQFMKNIILFGLSLFVSLSLFSQKITVEEKIEKIADGKYNSLVVFIPEASLKNVSSEWKSKMKDAKAKVSGSSEMFADNALLTEISENAIDVYANFSEKDNGVVMVVAFNLGGAYLNSKEHAPGFRKAQEMVQSFAVSMAKEAVNKKMEDEKEQLSKTEKTFEGLEKDNKNLASDIEKYKSRISEAEKNIDDNNKKMEELKKEIESQKKQVESTQQRLNKIN